MHRDSFGHSRSYQHATDGTCSLCSSSSFKKAYFGSSDDPLSGIVAESKFESCSHKPAAPPPDPRLVCDLLLIALSSYTPRRSSAPLLLEGTQPHTENKQVVVMKFWCRAPPPACLLFKGPTPSLPKYWRAHGAASASSGFLRPDLCGVWTEDGGNAHDRGSIEIGHRCGSGSSRTRLFSTNWYWTLNLYARVSDFLPKPHFQFVRAFVLYSLFLNLFVSLETSENASRRRRLPFPPRSSSACALLDELWAGQKSVEQGILCQGYDRGFSNGC